MKKTNKKGKAGAAGTGADSGRCDLLRDAGGFDWGWPSSHMLVGNQELSRRFLAGGFAACGYGAAPNGMPFIALMGDNVAGMCSALALMREWVDGYGPNAIRLEIAFDGPGYVLAISQQLDLMRWRIGGIDTSKQPWILGVSHMKRLDSRHPSLERLAEYSRMPVAPVILTVGGLPARAKHVIGSVTTEFEPLWNEQIWLPGLNIYTDPSQRPVDSMARLSTEVEERKGPPAGWEPPTPSTSPPDLACERNRRLSATLPKTLHVLRYHRAAASLFVDEKLAALERWRIEQAICNLRIRDYLPYAPKSQSKRFALLAEARDTIIEPASEVVDLTRFEPGAVAEQLSLDAAYLLRRIEEDREPPEGLDARIARLRELGYA
jgi:hypothetical protein